MSDISEEKTESIGTFKAKLTLSKRPPPACGEILIDREIPSDLALVTPLVFRTIEFLKSGNFVRRENESTIALCLEEALQNSVKHGNQRDFKKKVRLQVFLGEDEWGVIISDEGPGFDLKSVRNPLDTDALWGESGRGLYLMSHYMDRTDYYNGGNTVVMAKKL